MKKILTLVAISLTTVFAQSALAQLEPFEDYSISDEVWAITTVRVNANMDDYYLEGLAQTWVASNKVAMELGQIEDFAIYRSELPQSGDFNLVLVVKFASSADLEPNQEAYAEFMEAWGTANQDLVEEKVMDYPSMREITGQYRLRKIDVK